MNESIDRHVRAWRIVVRLSLLVCCTLASVSTAAVAGDAGQAADGGAVPVSEMYAHERALFEDARYALRKGQFDRYRRNLAKLESYPLYYYLVHREMRDQWRRRRPDASALEALEAFAEASDDDILIGQLTYALQSHFLAAGLWRNYLELSESPYARHSECAILRARYETGDLVAFDEAAVELWVQAQRQPRLCRGVLSALEKRSPPPITAIWEKIFTAIAANRPELAEVQMHYLGTRDRRWVRDWLDARKRPQAFLESGALDHDTVLNRRMLADLVEVWSRTEPVAAADYWHSVSDNYVFFSDRYYDTSRALAMRAAYRRLPEAYALLSRFDARPDDLELMEWRVRAALFEQNWPAVLESIALLPGNEQKEDHWAYWVARALETTGRAEAARPIYERLAAMQSFHGFLAADRLGEPYYIENLPIEPEASVLARLREDEQLVRAREYFHVGLTADSRREWSGAMKRQSIPELAASAVLAKHWQMPDRAIFSAGRAEQRQALELRFPVLYRAEVARSAAANRIEPAWVYGVMRRESAYIADVRSHAGAIGLMQLMPQTAQHVARLKGHKSRRFDLTDAATNIGFGTYYLRHVLDEFDGHLVLATASYNAGPSRVRKWFPDAEMAADIWIDTIPYTETRRYVRAVLAYTAIYEWHLTSEPTRFADKFRAIPAATGT